MDGERETEDADVKTQSTGDKGMMSICRCENEVLIDICIRMKERRD